jgi:outer membrane protein assembly factor BamB
MQPLAVDTRVFIPGVSSMSFSTRVSLLVLLVASVAAPAMAGDWARFRGPNGSGVSTDKASIATTWSDTENLLWKAELPGPGSSSPIVVGDKVFVTCWTGYAADDNDFGSLDKLKRHLICLDRKTGKTLWNKSVDAVLPEDSFRGMFAENGYATHTPVSDGENVYVFFGKSGAHAFTLDGEKLWSANAGSDLDRRGWGSASSPIVYGDSVIVTAAIESRALIALDKKTGKELWKTEANGFGSTWGTPVIVGEGENSELVLGVPYEIWSLNPANGKLRWYAEALQSSSICSSVVTDGKALYAVGGREGGSIAIKAGGKGDVTKSHQMWVGRDRARIGTPVVHDGLVYWISGGIANCIEAETGQRVYQSRLEGASSQRGGGGRSRGGRGGGNDYSSAVVGGGKLIYVSRSGTAFVMKLGREFEQLATNKFASDNGDYSATPAISDGQLFIRSSRNVYCVAETK